jgi:Carboxypeptidase regulatory-like domain
MSAKKRRLDQLQVVSPCSTDWDRMSGDEKKRFCSDCDKFVYDFSQMTRRQVEAIVSINRGRMCARITRRPDGSLLTMETPPVHPVIARRASPVVNATLAAILGISVPASALNVDVSAAQLIVRSGADSDGARAPYGGGEALVGGTVFDPQGAVIPNAVVKLISDAGAELETKTSGEGEFTFARVPFGAYIMLIEAQGFYTHVNSNVIVDTPYDTRFEVTMKVERVIAMAGGVGGGHPQSLFDLYRESDLVAIARVGRSTVVETEDGAKQIKAALHITSQFKGENSRQVISLYHWVDDSYQIPFKPGDRLLVLLQRRESEEGERLDGYEATGWGDGVKQLDDGALEVYRQRIEELTAIIRRGNPDPAEFVEWLVRCAEEPATRQEGVSKLSDSLSELESQREKENEDKSQTAEAEESADQSGGDEDGSNEQSNDDDRAEMRRESVQIGAALTEVHKIRLANTLFGIAKLSEDDMELAELVQKWGDERLAPYLISQLRRVADDATIYARSLIRMIAGVINNEDLKRLANDYGNAAMADILDIGESDDGTDRQDSTRNQPADFASLAAIKRNVMLKDFLKLAEYKIKR